MVTLNAEKHIYIVGPVRFAWMNVFKPHGYKAEAPKYSVTMLIPKLPNKWIPDPKSEMEALKAKFVEVMLASYPKGTKPAFNPILDGDEEIGEDGKPRFPGYWMVKATTGVEYPPEIVDGKGCKVTGGWKSGDWGRVKLTIKPYGEKAVAKGVKAWLSAVQFLYVDEPLGFVVNVAEEFGDVEDSHTGTFTGSVADEYQDPFADA